MTGALAFIGAPNFEAPADAGANNVYDVIVRATATGGSDDQAIAVTVTNINEAPVITSNGGGATASISMAENIAAVTTVVATDPENDARTYSIVGGADAALFTINAATGALAFIAAPDADAPADADLNNVYDVVVRASSTGGTDDQAISVTIGNVNEPPVITSNGGGATASISIAENTTAVTTVTASDPENDARTYSIVGGADAALFTINAATGALTFISGRNFESPADVGANNIYDVIVRATATGGSDDQSIAVTVTNVNEAPDITSNGGAATAAINVAENTTAVTTVTATDPEGDTRTYSIVGGADAALFTINAATGALTFVSGRNFENPTDAGANNVYDVVVRATSTGGTDDQTIAVTVTNVNEVSVITSNGGGASAAISIAENTTAVTTVTATDPESDPITYSISGGADAAFFTINASTGVLTFVAPRNFEAPADAGANNVYDVIVRSTSTGGFDTQNIAVTITNVNEAPDITSNGGGATASISVAENTTAVTTVTSTDPEGDTRTYSIVGGADAALFTINAATGVLSFIASNNFESPGDSGGNNVYDVIVRATSTGGTDDQTIAVSVTNVNEAPTNINLVGSTVTEGSANGTLVGAASGVDPDASPTFTFSFAPSGDAGGRFAIDANTGAITVANSSLIDFETNASHSITIRVTDQGGLFVDRSFTINVTNVNEAPTITSNGGGTTAAINVAENTTAVTTVVATDPEGDTRTYSIVGGADAALFTINAATGVLTFIGAQDFEAPGDAGGNNVFDVIVRASSTGGTDDQTIAVTLTNTNEAPVITSNGGGSTASISITENTTAITTVTSVDPEGDTRTYSIVGGADAALFTINAATGVLTFIGGPDFETPAMPAATTFMM